MDIKDINRIALKEGDVLWVTVAKGHMPPKMWAERAKNIKEALQLQFLSTRIIVTGDDVTIHVIGQEVNIQASEMYSPVE